MRKTKKNRRSSEKTSPSQNGSTASRSTRPAALSANLSLARAGERCRLGACSTATHSRARYSAEKTMSENPFDRREPRPVLRLQRRHRFERRRHQIDDNEQDDDAAQQPRAALADRRLFEQLVKLLTES